jgi:hypothetical protein
MFDGMHERNVASCSGHWNNNMCILNWVRIRRFETISASSVRKFENLNVNNFTIT